MLAQPAHKSIGFLLDDGVLAACAQWERPHALTLICGEEREPADALGMRAGENHTAAPPYEREGIKSARQRAASEAPFLDAWSGSYTGMSK